MQLDGVLRDALFGEEVSYLDPLITLKLDDLTHFLVVNEVTVAGEFLCSGYPSVHLYPEARGHAEHHCTFLNALRSFLGSYSVNRL